MLRILIIVAAAGCAVSAVHTTVKELRHGDKLILDVPDKADKLEFIPEKGKIIRWSTKGKVILKKLPVWHVTFELAGTYNLLNALNIIISSYKVTVKGRRKELELVPGETLIIPLEGLQRESATLLFKSNGSEIPLVTGDMLMSDPYYINRLTLTSETINVLNVNVSDLGEYILQDSKRRIVSKTTFRLVERHSPTWNKKALIALVLLVIPVIFCCYCMCKFCCKDDESNTATTKTLNSQPETTPMCPIDPSQIYPTLPVQGQIQYHPSPQWNGQPAVSPYPNPVYPPGPAGLPAQAPQLNVPPNQYYPPAPVNYNPLINSASPGL